MKKSPADIEFDKLNAFQKQTVLDVLRTLGAVPDLRKDYKQMKSDKMESISYLADEAFGDSDCWGDRPEEFQNWLDENGRADVIAGHKTSILQQTLAFLIDQVARRTK